MMPTKLWDIFCRVIDNHGDLGVCWRLAEDLASRGQRVRLWVDEPSALAWMAPAGFPGVDVLDWTPDTVFPWPGDVVIEAFGCEIAPSFIAASAEFTRARGLKGFKPPVWINLEYLSAEKYVERLHTLPSPVLVGPGAGLTKYFFYPGFTPRTGGLLREADLLERQARFDRTDWLAKQGVGWEGERLISLFCYEPAGLAALLEQLAGGMQPTRLLVTAGRAEQAVRAWMAGCGVRDGFDSENGMQPLQNKLGQLSFLYLPLLSQTYFDHLLWACDFNLVRGEDSLVRAIWAGQPFAWHIYPQHDNAHHDKLRALLHAVQAPADLHDFHLTYNGMTNLPFPPLNLPAWGEAAQAARARLLAQTDLCSQLMGFVAERS